MSKFSSYPEQQLVFEKWRSYNQPSDEIDLMLENLTADKDRIIREGLDEVLGYGAIEKGKVSDKTNRLLNFLDWALAAIGLIPGLGIVFDVLSALLAYLRGQPGLAVFSLVAALPGLGYAAAAARALAKAKGQKGIAAGAKKMVPVFKKIYGSAWEAGLRKSVKDATRKTSKTTTKLVNRYYKDNPTKAADILDDFYDGFIGLEKLVFKVLLVGAGGAVGAETGKVLRGDDGESAENQQQPDKLVYSNNGVEVYQVDGVGYVLQVDGEVKGKYSLKRLKDGLGQAGWKI